LAEPAQKEQEISATRQVQLKGDGAFDRFGPAGTGMYPDSEAEKTGNGK